MAEVGCNIRDRQSQLVSQVRRLLYINDGLQVFVNEKTGIVLQYAKCVLSYSSQYGSNNSVSYTVSNLAGEPRVYPKYGDFTVACVFRTYGPWWKQAPSASKRYLRTTASFRSDDFVELSLARSVVPLKIFIFETYNPGSIVRIMACDTTSGTDVDTGHQRWVTLWSGGPESCPPHSRQFSPVLKMVNFSTTLIRLELDHSLEEYYTELDAVLVVGSIDSYDVPVERFYDKRVSEQKCMDPMAAKWEEIEEDIQVMLSSGDSRPAAVAVLETYKDVSDESLRAESGYFAVLSDELIQLILTYVDLPSLCQIAQTCRLLHLHAYDPMLYTEINLQPYWPTVSGKSLESLQYRCCKLQRLSLAWCGSAIRLEPHLMISFFEDCGCNLRELNLSCVPIANEDLLVDIFKNCPVLVDLDLSFCSGLENAAFEELVTVRNFKKVQRLVLYNTSINRVSATLLISNLPFLRHLNLGSCICIDDFTEVAFCLASNCKLLESVDLWRARTLNSTGLAQLATNCPQLRELDLGWCTNLKSSSQCFRHLAKQCPLLKKLFLTAIRSVNDHDLVAIAEHCRDLQQLDVLGTGEITAAAVFNLLEMCRKLTLLDVSFCSGISSESVADFREYYPAVDIKKSYQSEDD